MLNIITFITFMLIGLDYLLWLIYNDNEKINTSIKDFYNNKYV